MNVWMDELLQLEIEYLDEVENIRTRTRDGEILVLFGGGATSDYIANVFRNEYEIEPSFFCDNDPSKWGSIYAGLKVINIDELIQIRDKAYIYISPLRCIILI